MENQPSPADPLCRGPNENLPPRAGLEAESRSPEETFSLGRRLGERLFPGAVLALQGELGSGKTLFTKGLACGLGVKDHHRVSSPTFIIRQVYEGRLRICHLDAYRLGGAADLLALGFEEDVASPAVVVVEWADRVAGAIPPAALTVTFEHLPPLENGSASGGPAAGPGIQGRRRIAFSGEAVIWKAALETLKIRESLPRNMIHDQAGRDPPRANPGKESLVFPAPGERGAGCSEGEDGSGTVHAPGEDPHREGMDR